MVVGLSVAVVALAGWIVAANREALHIPGLAAAPASQPTQAAEVQAEPEAVVAAPAEPPAPEPVVTAQIEPPVPEPVVVASADETAPLAGTLLAPAIEADVTGSTDVRFGPDEAVPLPPKRPLRVTALPVPRPRPDLGDTAVPTGRELTDAEIERMR